MDRPALFEHNDVVAWLILGYLCSNPDAKDTVDGIEKWWLRGVKISTNPTTVQDSLDDLVKSGRLTSSECQGTGTVYGLNKHRRGTLQQYFQHKEE